MDGLRIEHHQQAVLIELDRANRRNALSSALIESLGATLLEIDRDEDVASIVLTGHDPAFCAGLDLDELRGTGIDASLITEPTKSPWLILRRMSTFVIAAINGPALTGGLELALCCHFRLASERSWFADTHVQVGLFPGGGLSGLLPQAAGFPMAMKMSMTGDPVDANEALSVGLVDQIVPHQDLRTVSLKLASRVTNSTVAIQMVDAYQSARRAQIRDSLMNERDRFTAQLQDGMVRFNDAVQMPSVTKE